MKELSSREMEKMILQLRYWAKSLQETQPTTEKALLAIASLLGVLVLENNW